MKSEKTTFENLVVEAGIVFFKHNSYDDKLQFDKKKLAKVFPHLKKFPKLDHGIDFYRCVLAKDRPLLRNLFDISLAEGERVHSDIRFFNKETNEILWLRIQIIHYRKEKNEIHRYCSVQNITVDKSELVRTTYAAHIDSLTGLINRERMKQKIALAIGTSYEYSIQYGLLAFNIDHLAIINSMFGYQITNDLIEAVAQKLASIKRKTDIIARISSGKFAILLVDTKDSDIKKIGERFLEIIRQSTFETRSGIISITASGAGCRIPEEASTSDSALTILEECLTLAKKRGRDNFVLYDSNIDMRKLHQENITLAGKVIQAIQNDGVIPAYQPILHKNTPHKSFMECLARIKDNDGNFIPAYQFIPVAENIGFIKNIDMKLFEHSLKVLTQNNGLRLSINMSGQTLYNVTQHSTFYKILEEYKNVSHRLCLELTETIPLQNIENLDKVVADIKKFGYKIALDDFGAGYNSFANLNHFEFDIVKVDGAYVRDIAKNKKHQIFVQTLTDLSKKLNLEIVAEMISEPDDLEIIKNLDIDYYQGYYFSPPLINFDEAMKITYQDYIESSDKKKAI